MKIKKIGHCCLVIKTGDVTILTDPGSYTTEQNAIKGIDIILITHEHADHLHVGSVQEVLKNNPQAKVISNTAVGKKLEEVKIPYMILEGVGKTELGGIAIEAFDCKHEEIFEQFGQVQNTGYFIDNKLLYPGDSFHFEPRENVEIMALPVAGPWCKIADAIRCVLAVKPKKAFPVHEFMLKPEGVVSAHKMLEKVLGERGIQFMPMAGGDEKEF